MILNLIYRMQFYGPRDNFNLEGSICFNDLQRTIYTILILKLIQSYQD